MSTDDQNVNDPRNPAYMDSYKREMELFHECPQCNCRCNCHEQPCSCCEDNQEEGEPVVSPEFDKRFTNQLSIYKPNPFTITPYTDEPKK